MDASNEPRPRSLNSKVISLVYSSYFRLCWCRKFKRSPPRSIRTHMYLPVVPPFMGFRYLRVSTPPSRLPTKSWSVFSCGPYSVRMLPTGRCSAAVNIVRRTCSREVVAVRSCGLVVTFLCFRSFRVFSLGHAHILSCILTFCPISPPVATNPPPFPTYMFAYTTCICVCGRPIRSYLE